MTNKKIIDFKSQSETFERIKNNDTIEFYINGNQLTNNSDNQLNTPESIDVAQIYKEQLLYAIRQYVGKSYDNVVFLSGAGTSMFDTDHASQAGPSMWSLAEYVDDNFFLLHNIRLSEIKTTNFDFFRDIDSANRSEYLYGHFEKYISYLESHPVKLNNGTIVKDEIFTLIINRVSNIDYALAWKHASILNSLIRLSKPNARPSVVTTNYDSLFEIQGDNAGLLVVDGFGYSRTPKFQDSNFDLRLMVQPLYESSDRLYEKRNAFNLLKLHGSLDWKKTVSDSQNSEYDIFRIPEGTNLDLKNRVMIFPSSNKYKSAFTEPYFELMSRFQALLRLRNTLLITSGFSFADMHILRMVKKAAKENEQLSMLITDPGTFDDSGELSGEFTKFSDLLNSSHRIAVMQSKFAELAVFLEKVTKDVYDNVE